MTSFFRKIRISTPMEQSYNKKQIKILESQNRSKYNQNTKDQS